MTSASKRVAESVQFPGSSSSELIRTISPDVRAGIRRLYKPWTLRLHSLARAKNPLVAASSSVLPKFLLGHFPRCELMESPKGIVS